MARSAQPLTRAQRHAAFERAIPAHTVIALDADLARAFPAHGPYVIAPDIPMGTTIPAYRRMRAQGV
jgi:hypothetical protein